MAADDIWYYTRGGQRIGPVTELDLANTIARGALGPDDLVWKEGMAQWVQLRFAEGLPQAPPVEERSASPAGVNDAHAAMAANGPVAAPAPDPYAPTAAAAAAHLSYAGPASTSGLLDYYTQFGVTYGGFWQRVLGHIIDGMIVGAPFCLIQGLVQAAAGAVPTPAPGTVPGGTTPAVAMTSVLFGCGMPIIQIVVFWMYYALQESSAHQATLGKRAMGLYVTDTFGRRITFARATGRHFASILSGLIMGIGYIMAAFTERKQTLHDMMAETLVMKRP